MKKIAFLTSDLPAPTGSGYRIRCYYLAKSLAQNFKIDIFSLSEKKLSGEEIKDYQKKYLDFPCHLRVVFYQPQGKNKLFWFFSRALRLFFRIKPASILRTYSKNFAKLLRQENTNQNYDLVIAAGLWMSQYFDYFPQAKKILDNQNIESDLYRQSLNYENFFLRIFRFFDWLKLRHYEKKENQNCDLPIVVSWEDLERLKVMTKRKDIVVIPNFVDVNYYRGNYPNPIKGEYIFFSGLLSYFPNEDSLIWFGEKIWPQIKKNFPRIKLVICGGGVTPKINNFFKKDKRVIITGYVKEIKPFRKNALVEIVPLRMGGGSRFKILEAFACGVPVVSTSIGAEGLDLSAQGIIIEDDPQRFSQAVNQLIGDRKLKEKMVLEQKTIIEKYDFKNIASKIKKIFVEKFN